MRAVRLSPRPSLEFPICPFAPAKIALAAGATDGDGSDDAMVLCTPKALPKHRCAGHCALGAWVDRLGHRRETEDRAQERARHMLG